MQITTIYDNTALDPNLASAWGFACLVGGDLLFDTGGNGRKLLFNMEQLGIDPAGIQTVVLSRAHGDHTGGLADAKGNPDYPNARIVMWQDMWDLWSAEKVPVENEGDPAYFIRHVVPVIAECVEPVALDTEFLPGFQAFFDEQAPHSTVGNERFAVAQDLEHSLALNTHCRVV